MAQRKRFQSKQWATHHIVTRVNQGYKYLTPTPERNSIIAGVLSKGLERVEGKVEIHFFSFLSNHYHLIVSAKSATDLSRFMQYTNGQIAVKLNKVNGKSGPFWASRYHSEELLDEESMVAMIRYVVQNSVKEGLVDHPKEWVGLHCYHQLIDKKPLKGKLIDGTRLAKVLDQLQRRGKSTSVDIDLYTTQHIVKITKLPIWSTMSANAYYEMCLTIFEAAIEEARAKRGSNMKPIGMAKVLTTPIDEPTELKRTRVRKICRSKCVEKLRDYLVVYSQFCAEYEAAMRLLKESISCGREYIQVRFPRGGVPPAGGYLPS